MGKYLDYDGLSALVGLLREELDSLRALACDNVMIAYHASGYCRPVKLADWPALEAAGNTAEGVLVTEGGRTLLVAPEGGSGYWASESGDYGGTVTRDMGFALADWEGKANTAAHMLHAECAGEDYANGFCAAYSRGDYGAGEWWLPSLGELMMIYANRDKVNYALSLIGGAEQLQSRGHWTSTVNNANGAWYVQLSSGNIYPGTKTGSPYALRPVTALKR